MSRLPHVPIWQRILALLLPLPGPLRSFGRGQSPLPRSGSGSWSWRDAGSETFAVSSALFCFPPRTSEAKAVLWTWPGLFLCKNQANKARADGSHGASRGGHCGRIQSSLRTGQQLPCLLHWFSLEKSLHSDFWARKQGKGTAGSRL